MTAGHQALEFFLQAKEAQLQEPSSQGWSGRDRHCCIPHPIDIWVLLAAAGAAAGGDGSCVGGGVLWPRRGAHDCALWARAAAPGDAHSAAAAESAPAQAHAAPHEARSWAPIKQNQHVSHIDFCCCLLWLLCMLCWAPNEACPTQSLKFGCEFCACLHKARPTSLPLLTDGGRYVGHALWVCAQRLLLRRMHEVSLTGSRLPSELGSHSMVWEEISSSCAVLPDATLMVLVRFSWNNVHGEACGALRKSCAGAGGRSRRLSWIWCGSQHRWRPSRWRGACSSRGRASPSTFSAQLLVRANAWKSPKPRHIFEESLDSTHVSTWPICHCRKCWSLPLCCFCVASAVLAAAAPQYASLSHGKSCPWQPKFKKYDTVLWVPGVLKVVLPCAQSTSARRRGRSGWRTRLWWRAGWTPAPSTTCRTTRWPHCAEGFEASLQHDPCHRSPVDTFWKLHAEWP